MNQELKKAITYRTEGKLQESNELLVRLVKDSPDDPFTYYQCAWSFDVLGKEREAVPYYEKAIELGLAGEDLEGAHLGLGSTYRTLGNYEKSREVFEKGLEHFPHNKALLVFYSMTLYNLKEHHQAMEKLLTCLVESTNDPNILQYKKAIRFYADKLDTIWES
jgi:tetratricopeptide (TPR) repeat protein